MCMYVCMCQLRLRHGKPMSLELPAVKRPLQRYLDPPSTSPTTFDAIINIANVVNIIMSSTTFDDMENVVNVIKASPPGRQWR